MTGWIESSVGLPPCGLVVETKIDDHNGVRNQGDLKLGDLGRLWWTPDGRAYVYYTPTHWRLK